MARSMGISGDRPASLVGVVAAALVVFGSASPWPGSPLLSLGSVASPATLLVGVALAFVFAVARRELLGRRSTAILAVIGGTSVIALSIRRLLLPAIGTESPPSVGTGLPLSLVGAALVLAFAAADYNVVTGSQLVEMARRVAIGFALAIGGLVAMSLVSIPLLSIRSIQDEVTRIALGFVLSPLVELALVALAILFVVRTGRGWGYFDVSLPNLRDVGYMVVGLLALLGVQIAIAVVIAQLDLPSSTSSVIDAGQSAAEVGRPELVLLMAPMMILVIGPAEELLYRNVIQKYLAGVFSPRSAVVVASFPFAVAHYQAYYSANAAELFVSLSSVLLLSLVLGTLYLRTENVVVPAVVHGVYNAILVVFLYVSLVFEDAVVDASAGLLF